MAQPWEQDWSANRQDAASETAKPWERDWGASAAPVKARQDGQMVSGFKRSFQEVPGMLAGVGAYAADLVGADAARDSMLGYAKRKQEEVGAAHANDAQSITDAWDGKVGWMDFLANASGYVAGQALQSIATGGLGALGAKMVAKQGAKELAEAAAAKAIAAGASEQLAQKAAADAVVGSINRAMKAGGVAGAMSHNFSMELGSIYPDAVEQAEKEGRALDGGDKFRVFAAASLAAGVDTAGEAIMAGRMLKGSASPSASILGRAAREVPAGMVREAGTEAVQTGIEQWGAARALDVREIVDSAGVGAIGGGLGGGVASLNRREEAAKPKLGAGDVLAAPTVDDAINTATLAISGPVAKPQWEVVDGALALPAPARQEPAGLLKALPAPDGGTVYMADSQGNVAPQPAEARTEALNRDTEARLQADALAQAERMQRELLGKQTPRGEEVPERVPVGEATEFQPIPAGETSEAIPTGEATELEPIPAGEATELAPETILADDLLARDGQPFGSKTGAQAKAYASGGGTVVAIPDHFGSGQPGYVVRQFVPAQPNNTRGTNSSDLQKARNDNQPDVDPNAGKVSGASDGWGAATARSGGALGLVPDAPRGVDSAAKAPEIGNRPADALASASKPNTALTTGDRITLAGKSYSVAAVTGKAVKLDDGAGGVRTVAKGSKTYGQITKDDAQQATATRTEATAPTAAAATHAAATPSGPASLEADWVDAQKRHAYQKARNELRDAMSAIDEYNVEWNSLYREGVAYFTGDGTARKLSPNAPDKLKDRYERLKNQKGALQFAYDDASARLREFAPASALRPSQPPGETPDSAAAENPKPRQLNGVDTKKASALFKQPAAATNAAAKPRVFKTKEAATKARSELGNTHRVQKVKGGFILRDATDKELAAAAKAGRRATSHTVDTGTDTLLKAVAKLGGLDRAGSSRDLGVAPEDFKHGSGLIGAPTFRVTGGQSPERMLEALKDHHYLPQDAGLRDLEDAIGNELRGRPQYSMAVDAEAALGEGAFSQPDEDSEPLADLTPDELDAEGYTSASPEVQALTESLLADAAAQQIDTEAIAETVAMQAEGLTQDQYHAAFQAAIREAVAAHQSAAGAGNTEAAGRGSEDRGRADGTEGGSQEGADQGLTLEAQTTQDLKAKANREAAATASERAKKAAEQERLRREAEARDIKARADQTVDDFQLGQSADQQLSGMGDMFTQPATVKDSLTPAPPAQQAAAILDAAAEPPKGAERLSVIKDVKAGAITPDEVAAAYPAAEPAEPAEKPKAAEPGKVDNFGEALPPARRAMAAKLDEELADSDIANRPLSEIWPLAENDAIEDTFAAAVAHAARAEIPAKPRVAYKVKQWVQKVKAVRGLAAHVLSGRLTRDRLRDEVGQKYSLRDWATKVFLLEQLPRGQWKRIGAVEERPDAYTYDDKSNRIPMPSLRIVIDDKPHYLRNGGTVDSNMQEIRGLLGAAAPEKRMEFEIRGPAGGPYKINKKGDGQYRVLMKFPTTSQAREAIEDDYASLVAAWEAIKDRDNITERDLRTADNRPRAGKDWRQGKDATPEQFQEAFGFKGGEFGKWVQQGKGDKERQAILNSAYDALMDLAQIAGVPPRAISLNGTLGIAFGSRGSGWASAHFEPSNLVINLTKTRGAGALAHEWLHALDNYFGRMRRGGKEAPFTGSQSSYRDDNYITHRPERLMVRKDATGWPAMTQGKLEAMRKAHPGAVQYSSDRWVPDPKHPDGVRPEVERRFADLVAALNASPMVKRARLLDGIKSGDGYWSRTLELAARAFENFVQARMREDGYHNDFLANVRGAEDVGKNPDRYPYLLPGEEKPIHDAFAALFDTIQTRTDDAGNVAMYSRTLSDSEAITEPQARAAVAATFGDKTARAMLEGGLIEFVTGRDFAGVTFSDGRIQINLSNVSQDNIGGILKHEAFHSAVREWIGDDSYDALMARLDSLRKVGAASKSPLFAKAAAAIPSDTPASLMNEEFAVYAIEQAESLPPKSSIAKWVSDFMSALRVAIIKRMPGGKIKAWALLNIKAEDLSRMAVAAMRARGAALRQGDGVMAYSRTNSRQTETAAFKRWFGDSKVVDADGKPMVVYHGTRSAFTTFDYSKIGEQGRAEGAGFYFTNSERVASGYGQPMEVFLSIQKPLAYDAKPFSRAVIQKIVSRVADLEAAGDGTVIEDGFLANFGDVRTEGLQNVIRAAADMIAADETAVDQLSGIVGAGVRPQFVNEATRDVTGFDGVVANGFSNAGDGTNRIFVAFFPEQIKSATGNSGAFDPDNADIRYSESAPTSEAITEPQARAAVAATFGDKTARAMLEGGLIEFVTGRDFAGVTFSDGRIQINLSNVSQDNIGGILKHEAFHSAVREWIGADSYDALMARLDSLRKVGAASKSPLFAKAAAAIPADTPASLMNEEFAGYAIEQAESLPPKSSIAKWVSDFMSALRVAIIKRMPGGKIKAWALLNIKAEDLSRMAVAAMRARGAALRRDDGVMAFSRARETSPGQSNDYLGAEDFPPDVVEAIIDDEDDRAIPAGWYLHGRSGSSKLNNSWPVQMTLRPRVAVGYAGNSGSVWAVRPNKSSRVANFESPDSSDMDAFIAALRPVFEEQKYRRGTSIESVIDAIAGSKGVSVDDIDFSMFENVVRDEFTPADIVNSAQAYDSDIFIALLEHYPGGWPDMSITPDGAVVIPGSIGNVESINLTSIKNAKQKLAQDASDVRYSRTAKPDWITSGSAALQGAAGKIDTYAPTKTIAEKVRAMSAGWKQKLVQGMFDAYAPLKSLSMDAYVAARMTKAADGAFEGMLMYGKPVMTADGGITGDLDGKGFLGAMRELGGEHDRFFMWLAGNRAERLMAEGKENLFKADEIAAMKALNGGTLPDGSPRTVAFKRALDQFNAYSKSVLDVAEKAGLIDGESRSLWEHDFYVPFYRMSQENEISGPAKIKGLVRQKAFERLKGGKENLGDLMDNTLRNWSHLLSASLANVAASKSLLAAEQAGIAFEAKEAEAKEMAKAAGLKGNATYFMDQGLQRWFVVEDPAVLAAISSMEAPALNGLPLQLMAKFKKYLTVGVTISPAFKVRNLIRDTLAAPGANEMSFNLAKNLAQGWKATDTKTSGYAQMLFSGGLMRFGTYLEGDRAENVKRLIADGVDDKTILNTPQKVKAMLGKAWDAWQDFGDRMENVNRTALYQQLLDKGLTPREAAYQARDMMDFSLQGSWAAMRTLTAVVPFLNARAQGLYKLGRSAVENPKRMGYMVAAVSLASIMLMLAYEDDDDWKAREDWDRDAWWWFKIGDTAYRIPKPFEIGAMGTIAERSLELAISDEMTGARFAERMKQMVTGTFAINPVPQMFKPMLDLYANTDSFTGRQIETLGMERLSKSERYGPNTSELAKALGSAGDYTGVSPVQVDHMIRAYFGWLGTMGAVTIDAATSPFSDIEKPAKKIDDYFGGFVKELPSASSRYLEDFYKQAQATSEVMADLRRAREVGDIEKATEIMEERGNMVAQYRVYQQAQRQLADINKRISLLRSSPGIDADTKRMRLDELSNLRNQLARRVSDQTRAREAALQ